MIPDRRILFRNFARSIEMALSDALSHLQILRDFFLTDLLEDGNALKTQERKPCYRHL